MTTLHLEVALKSRAPKGDHEWPRLTIGQAAERAGVAASTIRYYESIGLLPEPDRVSGQRRYDDSVLGRLAFIGVAQSAGFSLAEIRELVGGIDGGRGMGRIRTLAISKLDAVEALLERTRAMKGWLEVARECGCETPSECALFPAEGDNAVDPELALRVVRVTAGDCRRHPTP